MQRFFITGANCALLVAALIGVPEVTGARFWHLRVSSIPAAQTLTLWGLAFGSVGNAGAALFLVNSRRERKLCWEWAAIFGALLGMEYAFVRGWFNFQWLQRALVWLRKHF